MQLNFSAVDLYQRCPRAYKLHHIDNIDPDRKSLSQCKANTVRKVIAQLHYGILEDALDQDILDFCADIWQQEIADPLVDHEDLNAIAIQAKPATKTKPAMEAVTKGEKAVETITTWCINYAKLECSAKILYNSVYFQDTIGDITFVGVVDQIREDKNGHLQAIRFSTSSQAPSSVYLSRDIHISLYAHALWQGRLFPNYPDLSEELHLGVIPTLYYYHFPHLEQYQRRNGKSKKGELKGNPMIQVVRSEQELLQFEYELLYTTAGIEMEYYPMHVRRAAGCSICNFAAHCVNGKATSQEITEPIITERKEITV